MNKDYIKQTLDKFKNYTFTIATTMSILHDRVKLQYIDTDSIIFINKYNYTISIQHSIILDIQLNVKELDVIILIGIMRGQHEETYIRMTNGNVKYKGATSLNDYK